MTDEFEPFIHLCVEIEGAAGQMFVACGKMKAFVTADKHEWVSIGFDEIDAAVKAAAHSVANYKAAILHGKTKLTSKEWEGGEDEQDDGECMHVKTWGLP